MFHAQHDPPTHKHHLYNLVLRCARKHFRATCVLVTFSFTPTFSNITSIFIVLHFESHDVFLVFFGKLWTRPRCWSFIWFLQINISMHVEFIYKWFFKDGFRTPPKLFSPKNSMSGFPQRFQLCSHITQGHIPHWITHIFGATHFLTMTKPSSGVHPITIRETLYRLTRCTLCF
jgi:hypothetical protein